jgi:hypothetical protein
MKLLPFLIFMLIFKAGFTQMPSQDVQQKYAASAVKEDLEHLYKTLQAAHYNLYVFTPKSTFDKKYETIQKQLTDSLTQFQVYKLFQSFAVIAKIGHCRMNYSTLFSSYDSYVRKGGRIFPLDVFIEKGEIKVMGNYSGNQNIEPGDKILHFNKKPGAIVLADVKNYISGEGDYIKNSIIELFSFPCMLWFAYGEIPSFKLTVKKKNGKLLTLIINAEADSVIQQRKQQGTSIIDNKRVFNIIDSVAYLKPGPFYNNSGGKFLDKQEYIHFIDSAFREIKRQKAHSLIVDLRNNPGGDNSFSDPMIAYFADKPFKFCSKYYLKTSDTLKEFWVKDVPLSFEGVLEPEIERMQKAILAKPSGSIFEYTIMHYPPRSDTMKFNGTVYGLINRHSYSNATATAAIIQDYGFGTLLGEETSDLPTSYASIANFALPNTQLRVEYPKGYFIRPSGDKSLKGVVPDIRVSNDIQTKTDEVLEFAMKYANGKGTHY